MLAISSLMNDATREDLHSKLVPCLPEEFIAAYLKRDMGFRAVLKAEFGMLVDVLVTDCDAHFSFSNGDQTVLKDGSLTHYEDF